MREITGLFFCILPLLLNAQLDLLSEWNYGGSGSDRGRDIYYDESDNTFVIAGGSNSVDIDLGQNAGDTDFWVFKIDQAGSIIWSTSIGGESADWMEDIQPASDGGYILSGYSYSSTGDFDNSHGSADSWILKLDSGGNLQWMYNYGGSGNDVIYAISIADNGQIGFAGTSGSSDIDLAGNYGLEDAWAGAIDENGNLLWSKNYGGTNYDEFTSISPTSSGGWIVGGDSYSDDFDLNSNYGLSDIWIMELTNTGEIENNISFGGDGLDFIGQVLLVENSGYLIAGYSSSGTGAFAGSHGEVDGFAVRLDEHFSLQWLQMYGGDENDLILGAALTPTAGFLLTGISTSSSGDLSANYGVFDAWLLEIDQAGAILHSMNYGGSEDDRLFDVVLANNDWLAIGSTFSSDIDVSTNYGLEDLWAVSFDPGYTAIEKLEKIERSLTISPNPAFNQIQLSLKDVPVKSGVVQIFHESGKLVLIKDVKEGDIDISGLGPNIYFLKFVQDEQVYWTKFVHIE